MSNEIISQTTFIKKIREKIPNDRLAANEIASLLQLSKSEVYNKLGCKSQFTISQIQTLCDRYDVYFEIAPKSNSYTCRAQYTPFHTGQTDVTNYLEGLNKFMYQLSGEGNGKLACATDDIPFFHLFKYPELAAFKLHFWESRITISGVNKPEKVFDYNKSNKKNIDSAFQLYDTYKNIPCTEIWTKSYLLITPDQLKYAIESQLIKDRSVAIIICDQLIQTLMDIEVYAIHKSKCENSDILFDWYQCDVVGNVSYLATVNDHKYCFLRFNTFNNLQTDDHKLCSEVEMWLQSLLNNSTGYSGQGSKHRNVYLQSARQNIENIRNMV